MSPLKTVAKDFESNSSLPAASHQVSVRTGRLAHRNVFGAHALDAINDKIIHPLSHNCAHYQKATDYESASHEQEQVDEKHPHGELNASSATKPFDEVKQ